MSDDLGFIIPLKRKYRERKWFPCGRYIAREGNSPPAPRRKPRSIWKQLNDAMKRKGK